MRRSAHFFHSTFPPLLRRLPSSRTWPSAPGSGARPWTTQRRPSPAFTSGTGKSPSPKTGPQSLQPCRARSFLPFHSSSWFCSLGCSGSRRSARTGTWRSGRRSRRRCRYPRDEVRCGRVPFVTLLLWSCDACECQCGVRIPPYVALLGQLWSFNTYLESAFKLSALVIRARND